MPLAEDREYPLRQSRVDGRQGTVVVVTCGGRGYRPGRKLRTVRQSCLQHWQCSARKRCVGSSCTFGAGPYVKRLKGNTRGSRYVGVEKKAWLLVFLCPRKNPSRNFPWAKKKHLADIVELHKTNPPEAGFNDTTFEW